MKETQDFDAKVPRVSKKKNITQPIKNILSGEFKRC